MTEDRKGIKLISKKSTARENNEVIINILPISVPATGALEKPY